MSVLRGEVMVFRGVKHLLNIQDGEIKADAEINKEGQMIQCDAIVPGDII